MDFNLSSSPWPETFLGELWVSLESSQVGAASSRMKVVLSIPRGGHLLKSWVNSFGFVWVFLEGKLSSHFPALHPCGMGTHPGLLWEEFPGWKWKRKSITARA